MWPLRGLTQKGEGTKLGAGSTQAQKFGLLNAITLGCEDVKKCKKSDKRLGYSAEIRNW
jgi:hypothetical protein